MGTTFKFGSPISVLAADVSVPVLSGIGLGRGLGALAGDGDAAGAGVLDAGLDAGVGEALEGDGPGVGEGLGVGEGEGLGVGPGAGGGVDPPVTVTVPEPFGQPACGHVPLILKLVCRACVEAWPPLAIISAPCGSPFTWTPPAYGSLDGTEKVIVSPSLRLMLLGVK